MRSRTLIAILAAVAIALAIGYTTASLMSGDNSNGGHTMPNGQTMTDGMSMGEPGYAVSRAATSDSRY